VLKVYIWRVHGMGNDNGEDEMNPKVKIGSPL
jgi:hypothetical protein